MTFTRVLNDLMIEHGRRSIRRFLEPLLQLPGLQIEHLGSAIRGADAYRAPSVDEADATLEGIRKGHIYGTVAQQPFEFGYLASKMMRNLVKGDKSGEMSVSNALTALTKANQVARRDGRYVAA